MQQVEIQDLGTFSRQFMHTNSAFRLYSTCELIYHGIAPPASDIWTDQVEDPRVVAIVTNDLMTPVGLTMHYLWAKPNLDYETFEMLMDTAPFDYKECFTVHQLSGETTAPLLRKYAEKKHRGSLLNIVDTPFKQFTWPSDNHIKPTKPLPNGLYIDSLNINDADIVSQNNLGETSVPTVQFYIKYLPTSCIRTSDGRCIARCLLTHYGTLGLLNVDPAFRRRGLASHLVLDFQKKLTNLNLDVPFYCSVNLANATSRNVFLSLGFKETLGYDSFYAKYTPFIA